MDTKFSLKLQDGAAYIIHESGNFAWTANADIVRLLQNASDTDRGGLDAEDMQCLMSVLYDTMGGKRPMKVHAA